MQIRTGIAAVAASLAISCAAGAGETANQNLTVRSPDARLVLSFNIKNLHAPYLSGNRPYYTLSFEGRDLLTDSPLGLQFDRSAPLDDDLSVTGISTESHDTSWEDPLNDNRKIRDHYNELTVHLADLAGARDRGQAGAGISRRQKKTHPERRLDIVFRAYDSGVAFHYVLPRQAGLQRFTLSSESTGFYFARRASAFALYLESFTTPYEDEFRQVALGEIQPSSLIGLPLLVQLHGGPWVAITEAGLEDYAGLYITGVRRLPNALATKLSPLPGRPHQAVTGSTPKASPWRVILVSSEPGGLIESHDLLLNLSPPCALGDTSWIEPGKTAWDWWSGDYATGVNFKPGMNTATLEHYIQFAADHHLPYMLIDAGWARSPGGEHSEERADITHWNENVDLPQILAFAKERRVKVSLWMHWRSVQNQMTEAFPLFEKWGVSGIKVDFMNRDDQEMVNFYARVTREAAKHHLVVDFHGAFKPTGMRRTYPNELTREGVLGMEYNKWSYRDTPYHHLVIPFTRMLGGPLDYTPGCFKNATRNQFEPRMVNPMCQGTRAHQLAMYVIYFSPLQMLSDYPEDYEHNPGMDFLDQVPTVWDETRVLNGYPGEFITMARRKDNTWYVGSMTDWTPRDMEIPLNFLGSGAYKARIYSDGPNAVQNASDLSTRATVFQSGDHLTVHLASGGGCAAVFTPIRNRK